MDDYTPPVDTTVTHTALGKIPNSYPGGFNSGIDSSWISPTSAAYPGARDAEYWRNGTRAANNSASNNTAGDADIVPILLLAPFVIWLAFIEFRTWQLLPEMWHPLGKALAGIAECYLLIGLLRLIYSLLPPLISGLLTATAYCGFAYNVPSMGAPVFQFFHIAFTDRIWNEAAVVACTLGGFLLGYKLGEERRMFASLKRRKAEARRDIVSKTANHKQSLSRADAGQTAANTAVMASGGAARAIAPSRRVRDVVGLVEIVFRLLVVLVLILGMLNWGYSIYKHRF